MGHFPLVFGAGLVAGAMNALAGGGSFVSLLALIAAGVPSVQPNASSTVALFPGGVASAWAYRDGLESVGSASLRSLLITILFGGVTGAVLLLWTPITTFNFVLPWLPLLATLALSFGRAVGEWLGRRWRIKPGAVLSIQFALGVYGGYFGGAVGIMMMAVWGLLGNRDLKSLNAPRTLLVSTVNIMAVLTFIIARAVHGPETVVMLVAAAIGRRTPPKVVRAGTLCLTACITLAFFIRAYVRQLPW